MKLHSLTIKNYRSIDELSFNIEQLSDNSYTYGLIGVNEAGKTTLLKALALKEQQETGEGLIQVTSKDFRNVSLPIVVSYFYNADKADINDFRTSLSKLEGFKEVNMYDFSKISISLKIDSNAPATRTLYYGFLNISGEHKSTIQKHLIPIIDKKAYKSIFWTAEDRYLISQPIDLSQFVISPETISIPLKNCFMLSGITDIASRVNSLNDSTDIEQLCEELGESVTSHINTVWPDHPIQITFLINNGLLNFHVKDLGIKGRAKTVDQRSDGFKQFISFLLTISAQDRNNELSNAVLLLDEPETHLHPQAQEYLMEELIKISQNDRKNVVFFATHSIFMIDKDDLNRNFRILKEDDHTKHKRLTNKSYSYASVMFEVFGIPTSDYHNELYGKLEKHHPEKLQNIKKDKKRYNEKSKKDEEVSLAAYIRHSIHHPENTNNKPYTRKELLLSIENLRKLL